MSNEINIELETIEVKSEEKRLRSSWKVCTSMKEWYGRLPRKKKKQLKKLMGEEGFVRWWTDVCKLNVSYDTKRKGKRIV